MNTRDAAVFFFLFAAAPLAVALALALVASAYDASGASGELVTYWGQSADEGQLAEICQTSLYDIVVISYLNLSGSPPQQPYLSLDAHCNSTAGDCAVLSSDIATCQSLNVRVLLSIGGEGASDAEYTAAYLWNAFLSGAMGEGRPLGPAILDGIDFDVEAEGASTGSSLYFGVLAQALRQLSGGGVLLTAAPGCSFPDARLGPELSGSALDADAGGAFDYVWVRFYDSPACDYGGDGDTSAMLGAWEQWTQALAQARVLLGIPAFVSEAGYIPPSRLLLDVLPLVQDSSNYGGIMLRSANTTYAASLRPAL